MLLFWDIWWTVLWNWFVQIPTINKNLEVFTQELTVTLKVLNILYDPTIGLYHYSNVHKNSYIRIRTRCLFIHTCMLFLLAENGPCDMEKNLCVNSTCTPTSLPPLYICTECAPDKTGFHCDIGVLIFIVLIIRLMRTCTYDGFVFQYLSRFKWLTCTISFQNFDLVIECTRDMFHSLFWLWTTYFRYWPLPSE